MTNPTRDEMPKPTIDDFCEDFDAALDKLIEATVAEVEADTKGMSEIEIADYWLREAQDHLAKVRELNAPECIIERAEKCVEARQAKFAALSKAEGAE